MTRDDIKIGNTVKYDGYPNNLYKVARINNGNILLDCIKGAYHCIPYANVEKMTLVEPDPQGLDEAAEDSWALYEYRESPKGLYSTCYVDGFKAGAEWMAGQGVVDEIEGEVCGRVRDHINIKFPDAVGQLLTPKGVSHIPADVSKYNVGDKVIVQIRKK